MAKIQVSGGGGSGGSGEITIQCDAGTSPVGSIITMAGASGVITTGNSGTDTVTISLGNITPTGISINAGTRSEQFGASASATQQDGVAVGNAAVITTAGAHKGTAIGASSSILGDSGTAIGYDSHAYLNSTAIGRGAMAGAVGVNTTTAVGYGAAATAVRSMCLGASTVASADSSHAFGNLASSTHQASIVIGYSAISTAANQCLIGGVSSRSVKDMYIGAGVRDDTPDTNVSIQPTGGGAGSNNIAGSNLVINAGRSTGSATPAAIIFQSTTAGASSTTPQTFSEKFRINGTGVGFFATTPAGQQTGAAQTAGGTYGATEQDMLQKAYNCLRTFGLLA